MTTPITEIEAALGAGDKYTATLLFLENARALIAGCKRAERLEAALLEIIKADRRCDVDMIEPRESTWVDGPSATIARQVLKETNT